MSLGVLLSHRQVREALKLVVMVVVVEVRLSRFILQVQRVLFISIHRPPPLSHERPRKPRSLHRSNTRRSRNPNRSRTTDLHHPAKKFPTRRLPSFPTNGFHHPVATLVYHPRHLKGQFLEVCRRCRCR